MKKVSIPTPVAIVVAVALVGGLILAFSRATATDEFPKPKPTGKTPSYILDKMPPDQRARIEKEERDAGLADAPDNGASVQPKTNPYGK